MIKCNIGFIGSGGIARSHAYALNAMRFFYDDVPELVLGSVTSRNEERRQHFAEKYGFSRAESPADFKHSRDIDTVFILGPNNVHFDHLVMALEMPSVERIYIEKPVCASYDEENEMKKLNTKEVRVQVGFQFLQTAAVREAIQFWKTGILGKPVHFDLKYYHGDYLKRSYRSKRVTRLTPAPDGGAMADLGSHGISLLVAFLGEDIQILSALQAGTFDDVPAGSDLFSSIALHDPRTRAVGHLSASRISAGTGDLVSLEIFAEKGALRYSTSQPDVFEYYLEDTGDWVTKPVNSQYLPITSFPSGHVPPGWLRSLIHAHYIFLTDNDDRALFPDLQHGLAVQRIVRETAEHLNEFRKTGYK